MDILLTEYNEKEVNEMFKEEGRQEGIAEGHQEGLQEGQEKMGKLIKVLLQLGRIDDVQKVATDSGYREKMYKKMGI